MREFDQLSEEDGEEARLRIIANRRAEASRPRWIEDVRTRKFTIATGEGAVHGRHYNLVEEYGLRLTEAIQQPVAHRSIFTIYSKIAKQICPR